MGGFFSRLFGTDPDPIKPNPVFKAFAQHAEKIEKEKAAAEAAKILQTLQRQQAESDAEEKKREDDKMQADRKAWEEAQRKKDMRKQQTESGDRKKKEEQSSREAAEARKTRESPGIREEKKDEQSPPAHASAETTHAQAPSGQLERPWKDGIQPIVWPTLLEIETAKESVQYKDGVFHIAVAGIAGSGKSSLINALRGIANKDKGPHTAPVGISETTTKIDRYEDPDAKKPFVWYDIPGAGTLTVPDWQYFHSQGLYVFDCIIVLFNDRFSEIDIALLKNCARYNIPSYIVGSKSETRIRDFIRDMPDDDSDDEEEVRPVQKYKNYPKARAEYIAQISQSVQNNLAQAGLPPQRVYLVDKDILRKVVVQASWEKYWHSLQGWFRRSRAEEMPQEPATMAQASEIGQPTAVVPTVAASGPGEPSVGAFPTEEPDAGAIEADAPRKGKSSKANKLDEQVIIHERELVRDMLVEGCNRRVKKWWDMCRATSGRVITAAVANLKTGSVSTS